MIVKTYNFVTSPAQNVTEESIRAKMAKGLGKRWVEKNVLVVDVKKTPMKDATGSDNGWMANELVIGFWEFCPDGDLRGWEVGAYIEKAATVDGADLVSIHTSYKYKDILNTGIYTAPDFRFGCDHCGTNRARRRAFVLIKANGETYETRMVAFSCAKEYLEINNEIAVDDIMNSIKKIERVSIVDVLDPDSFYFEMPSVADNRCNVNVPLFIRITKWVIEKNGYHNSESACPTSHYVKTLYDEELKNPSNTYPTEEEMPLEELRKFWMANRHDSVFNNNVYVNLYATRVKFGLLAYAVKGWMDSRKPVLNTADSEHIGAVGDRIKTSVTVTFKRAVQSYYGNSTIFKFTDGKNLLMTYSSGNGMNDISVGQTINIKGTIKAHDTDKYSDNAKITILNRVATV